MPAVSSAMNGTPIPALPADNVERTADTVDGLVKDDIVLKRIGAGHIIIVRIPCPPDDAGCAILGPGDGLELRLNETVLDVGIFLQKQRIGSSAGLLDHFRF